VFPLRHAVLLYFFYTKVDDIKNAALVGRLIMPRLDFDGAKISILFYMFQIIWQKIKIF
jgi:hypothetical protein